MKEYNEESINRFKELLPNIRVDDFLHEIKPEHREDFLKKMYKMNVNKEREQNGGHKGVHKTND